jgi:hypothetical protein
LELSTRATRKAGKHGGAGDRSGAARSGSAEMMSARIDADVSGGRLFQKGDLRAAAHGDFVARPMAEK